MALLLLALKSLLVAAATLLLLRVTRRRSAAERSTIAHLGLFALVALPLASLALPSLPLTLPETMQRIAAVPNFGPVATSATVKSSTTAADAAVPSVAKVAPPAPAVATEQLSPVMVALESALMALARHAYLIPTAALLLLTLLGLARLVRLRARAEVLIEPEWLQALARAQRRMGFKSGTALLRSDELVSPISWGLMRPTILLSEAAARAPEQAEAIIAHELAHVVQLDWAKLMLARVATAAFWFNPLAWVLAREAHQLREEAADDAVLAANVAGPDYAELLIGVARHESRGMMLGAHGVAPSRDSLRRRVARVLDASPARGPSGKSWVAGFAAGMLCMAAPLAAVTLAPGHAATAAPEHVQAMRNVVADAPVSPAAAAPAATRHDAPTVPAAPKAAATVAAIPAGAESADGDADVPTGPVPPDLGKTIATAVRKAQLAWRVAPQVSVHIPPLAVAIAAAPVPEARPAPQIDVDQIIQMHNVGVTPEYKRALAAAGFPNLTVDQLVQARSLGVTPEYARAMHAAGMSANFDEMLHARAIGLDPGYIGEMRRLGVNASIEQYQGLVSVGVTPEYVRALRAHGLSVTSPSKLTQLKAVGFDPDKPGDDP